MQAEAVNVKRTRGVCSGEKFNSCAMSGIYLAKPQLKEFLTNPDIARLRNGHADYRDDLADRGKQPCQH